MSIGAEASALLSVLGVIGCAALVHAGSWGWRPLEIKWLGWLGLVSYEVYLWQGLTSQFRINWLLQIAAALVLGWCTWNFIGQRFLVDRKLMAGETSVSGSVLKVGLLSIPGEPDLDQAAQRTALGRGRNNLEN
jgi:peptidoglycan/LPS O-acetylase OafA/YrhL